jgi:ABC-type glycerol-3-phosphate transport system substrate-binding protein
MPLYLLGVPFVWNKELFAKAGLDSTHGPRTWQGCSRRNSADSHITRR